MRWHVVGGWLLCAGLVQAMLCGARAEDGFPYTAYINVDDVYVRSGPGKNYYPTCKLPRGATVEVYRHDPGGWYAIRPTEHCFSWVSGKYLKPEKDGLGVITGDRVVARVGSEFSDIRDVIQVRFYRGEEIEVLGAKKFGEGSSAQQTWYRIAPPAGEFRWVYGKFVDNEPPTYAHARPDSRQNLIINELESKDDNAREKVSETKQRKQSANDGPEVRQTSATVALADGAAAHGRREADKPPERESGTDDSNVARRPPRETPAVAGDRKPDVSTKARAKKAGEAPLSDFEGRLKTLDLDLSIMVAEEPTAWSFDSIRARAEQLLGEAETAVERGNVRLLLGRIERFEDVRRRYRAVADLGAETDRRDRELSDISRLRQASVRRLDPAERYDGSGQLTRVSSQEYGAPRYALLDQRGNVRYYVTPAPGINLQHYLGRRIGVTGYRSYRPELPAQHLTAKRVALLDGPVRR